MGAVTMDMQGARQARIVWAARKYVAARRAVIALPNGATNGRIILRDTSALFDQMDKAEKQLLDAVGDAPDVGSEEPGADSEEKQAR